jgi:hypothetical protein
LKDCVPSSALGPTIEAIVDRRVTYSQGQSRHRAPD